MTNRTAAHGDETAARVSPGPRPESSQDGKAARARLPLVVYVLAIGTFLMLTTEFVVAGILSEVAGDLGIGLAQAGQLITVFALGMIIGAPLLPLLTVRLSKRLTLVLALLVFTLGHGVVALSADFAVLLVARFVTALATGTFWAVSAVVATQAAGSSSAARAMGVVTAGGALATVLGVPIGVFIAQLVGWRGTFWALAVGAVIATGFVARLAHTDSSADAPRSLRGEVAGLRSSRLWLALLACATTTGGVLAAYSYVTPLLTDRAGVPAATVPLVLTGFGVGSLAGTLAAGRLGDAHPGAVTIATPAVTILLLVGIAAFSATAPVLIVLIVLLGLFGLSANGVLISFAVRFAGRSAALGSGLAVAAFNAGTAVGTTIAGATITSPLGLTGPATIGTVVIALTLIPTAMLAVTRSRTARSREAAA